MYISVGFYCVFTQASCCCAAQLPSPSIQSTSHLHVSSPRRHPFNTAASCPVLRMNALSKCSPAKLRFTFAVILYTRHFASALLCAFDSRRIRVFSGVLQLLALITCLPEMHAHLFSRHASASEVIAFWRSTKQVEMLCPTMLAVDVTDNSKERGVTAEVCSSQTGL